MKIGDTVYAFNFNRRVYSKEKNDHAPIYDEHFYEVVITGETKFSWITEYGAKYKKKLTQYTPYSERLFTKEEKDKAVWLHDNQYKIVERVRSLTDYDMLVKINKILEG